jgi:hypothetical protein
LYDRASVLPFCIATALALAMVLLISASAWAAGDGEGCGCHGNETATWESSTHAQSGPDGKPIARCETCHGAYVKGHPDAGMMELTTDSAMCGDCHADIHSEWQASIHGNSDVQCISCHIAHSQNLRLTEDELCNSCHRDAIADPLHTAHYIGEAPCTSCHMAPDMPDGGSYLAKAGATGGATAHLASLIPIAAQPSPARHDFISVSSAKCMDCHRADVTTPAADVGFAARLDLLDKANQVQTLRSELNHAEQTTSRMGILGVANLGLGVGLGGVFGIAFMLLAARWSRSKERP